MAALSGVRGGGRLGNALRRAWARLRVRALSGRSITSEQFWSRYNVTAHRRFQDREESLRYFNWRSEQYYDYLDHMPVHGHEGQVVLDYGCGPGHDLVGFAEFSKPARLIGMDVSADSLVEARLRLELHSASAELLRIREDDHRLPLADASVDYIHSSGVLHHVPDPARVLREFRRVLRPGGAARVMVYNYDCLWLHLYAAYLVRFRQAGGRALSVREAFRRSTDDAACPISEAWTIEEMKSRCRAAGFAAEHLGNAVSVREMAILSERFEAILEPDLEDEHRRFLLGLTFDRRGVPFHGEQAAGIDACYRLVASDVNPGNTL